VAVPDPNAESTFLDSKLDWTEREQEPHATLLRLHRELIALRRAWPELTDPWLDEVEVAVDEEARTIVVHRGKIRVACNLSGEPASLPVGPIARILLASEPVEGSGGEVKLPPESFAIVLARSAPAP
jgi:maltooligosyltrehalose trehalohydrolase